MNYLQKKYRLTSDKYNNFQKGGTLLTSELRAVLNRATDSVANDHFVTPLELESLAFTDEYIRNLLTYITYTYRNPLVAFNNPDYDGIKELLDTIPYMKRDLISKIGTTETTGTTVFLVPGDSPSKIWFALNMLYPELKDISGAKFIIFPISGLIDVEDVINSTEEDVVTVVKYFLNKSDIDITNPLNKFVYFDYVSPMRGSGPRVMKGVMKLINPEYSMSVININKYFMHNSNLFDYIIKSDKDNSRCQLSLCPNKGVEWIESGIPLHDFFKDSKNVFIRCNIMLHLIYLYHTEKAKLLSFSQEIKRTVRTMSITDLTQYESMICNITYYNKKKCDIDTLENIFIKEIYKDGSGMDLNMVKDFKLVSRNTLGINYNNIFDVNIVMDNRELTRRVDDMLRDKNKKIVVIELKFSGVTKEYIGKLTVYNTTISITGNTYTGDIPKFLITKVTLSPYNIDTLIYDENNTPPTGFHKIIYFDYKTNSLMTKYGVIKKSSSTFSSHWDFFYANAHQSNRFIMVPNCIHEITKIRDDKYSLAHCALVCSTYSVIDIEYTTDGTDFKQFVDVLIYTPFSYQNLSPVTINLSNSRDKNNKLGSICIAQIDKITIKKQIDKEVFFDHFGITDYDFGNIIMNSKHLASSRVKITFDTELYDQLKPILDEIK